MGECSNSPKLKALWRDLWKMRVPQKVCIFAWRACREGLPSLYNLCKWISGLDSSCFFCKQHVEDTAHVLVFCLNLQSAWCSALPIMREVPLNLSLLELAVWVWERKEPEVFTLFFIIAWSLCGRRNKGLYEHSICTLEFVIETALANQSLFKEVSVTPLKEIKRLGCWTPTNFFKLNTDGALFFDRKEAGIGVILRDGRGDLMMAMCKKEVEIVQNKTIECLAILQGLQFCLQNGITNLMVERITNP